MEVSFRFQWEGATGLVRMFQSNCHNVIFEGFGVWLISTKWTLEYNKSWLGVTTHWSTDGTQFIQADQVLYSHQRLPKKKKRKEKKRKSTRQLAYLGRHDQGNRIKDKI